VRCALLLIALAACVDDSDPPWQLHHDRVLAIAAEPPGILPGQSATITGLLAHADAPVSEEQPVAVTALSPRALFAAVHYNVDHWQIDCPTVATPTPLVVEMRFAAGEVATKTVWLGTARSNPAPPIYQVPDPVPLHVDIDLRADDTWFTSCGTLDGTTWREDDPCAGELVGVHRDADTGVSWRVWPVQ
jgi:hypothetical protein